MALFNRNISCLDACKAVCGQLGLPLPISAVNDPSNTLVQQLLYLLNSEGQKLIKPQQGYRWQCLKRTWDLSTVPGQTRYTLPDDWDSFIDQTAYGKPLAQQLMGPIGDATWSAIAAATAGPTFTLLYRTRGNMFEVYAVPSTPQNLRIDYTSRGWAQATAGGAYKDTMTADDDICLYDADLIQAALKLRFLKEKGFDTQAAQNDFDLALELAINADTDAAVLDASAGGGYRLIGIDNVPDSGYGQ